MKLKAFLLALCTAGFAVSIAVAASPAAVEHGKPGTGATTTDTTSTGTTTGEHAKKSGERGKGRDKAAACKPHRKLVVQGDFVAAGAGGFAMTVKKGNHGAKGLAGKQVSVLVDAKTHFHGAKKKLEALAAGDRLVVQAFACKTAAAAGQAATASLLARKVGVKGPKAEKVHEDDDADDQDEDEDEDEQTTTGSSTGTTTGS